jgi:hypothetical protein
LTAKGTNTFSEIAEIHTDSCSGVEDLMTTRIFTLEGIETSNPDNTNAYARGIYIHGTNCEGEIGTRASHGCVRMKNTDIVELSNLIDKGIYVNIVKP